MKNSTGSSVSPTGVLETQIKLNLDLGREIEWKLVSARIDDIRLNPLNNRFAPDKPLTNEEQEQLIVEEDVLAFENLRKSMGINPQLEPLIGHLRDGEDGIFLISGHRRWFAAKKEGITTTLIWVACNLSPDEVEHIRDWPEIHQTKVQHSTFAKHKAISDDLKNRSEIERERRIAIWRQKGYTRQQIEKSERTFGRMEAFCESTGEKAVERATQVKAFETYDGIVENTFATLRDQGEYEKVVELDKVAKAFLRHKIAHDDLKEAVEGLATLPKTDPIFSETAANPNFLDDIANLRRITNTARNLKSMGSIETEVRNFTARVFSKLVDRADDAEIRSVVKEFKDTATRLETVLGNIQGRVEV